MCVKEIARLPETGHGIGIDLGISKVCSECGHLMDVMALSIRERTCPNCGVIHDRDINAARDILALATGGRATEVMREEDDTNLAPVALPECGRPMNGEPSGNAWEHAREGVLPRIRGGFRWVLKAGVLRCIK
ncbi:transposase [Gammaproteobacteria bacterium]